MPIILKEKDPFFGKMFLWNVTEEPSIFRKALLSTGLKMDHIVEWHPKRQKEWMSGRYLLHLFMEDRLSDLSVDKYGKPSFPNSPNNFSISHTEGLVGLQYHDVPIGLDLQIRTDKIQRVAHKFCSDKDYAILGEQFDKLTSELITWGLKEAVFKAYGKGSLSYLNHIFLEELKITSSSKKVKIRLANDHHEQHYIGRIRMIGAYCLSQVLLTEE